MPDRSCSRPWRYVLAILAKEMAVTLPIVCVLIDRSRHRRAGPSRAGRRRDGRRDGSPCLSALLAVGALALALTYGGHVLHLATERPWHGGSSVPTSRPSRACGRSTSSSCSVPGRCRPTTATTAFRCRRASRTRGRSRASSLLAAIAAVGWQSWRQWWATRARARMGGGRTAPGLASGAVSRARSPSTISTFP